MLNANVIEIATFIDEWHVKKVFVLKKGKFYYFAFLLRFWREKNMIKTSIPPKWGEMKHREFWYVSKNERKLCVDNIRLCDERKPRKISENKLHHDYKSPHQWR